MAVILSEAKGLAVIILFPSPSVGRGDFSRFLVPFPFAEFTLERSEGLRVRVLGKTALTPSP